MGLWGLFPCQKQPATRSYPQAD